jgi:hypothetical protein
VKPGFAEHCTPPSVVGPFQFSTALSHWTSECGLAYVTIEAWGDFDERKRRPRSWLKPNRGSYYRHHLYRRSRMFPISLWITSQTKRETAILGRWRSLSARFQPIQFRFTWLSNFRLLALWHWAAKWNWFSIVTSGGPGAMIKLGESVMSILLMSKLHLEPSLKFHTLKAWRVRPTGSVGSGKR